MRHELESGGERSCIQRSVEESAEGEEKGVTDVRLCDLIAFNGGVDLRRFSDEGEFIIQIMNEIRFLQRDLSERDA